MRQTRNHLAMVVDADEFVGLITLTDVLKRLLPEPGPLRNDAVTFLYFHADRNYCDVGIC